MFIPQLMDLETDIKQKKGFTNFIFSLKKKLDIVDLSYQFKQKINYKKLYLGGAGGHLSSIGNSFLAIKIKKHTNIRRLLK